MPDQMKTTGIGIAELLLEIKEIESSNKLWYLLGIVATTRYWIAPEERATVRDGLEHARTLVEETPLPIPRTSAVSTINMRIHAIEKMAKERPAVNSRTKIPASEAEVLSDDRTSHHPRTAGFHT